LEQKYIESKNLEINESLSDIENNLEDENQFLESGEEILIKEKTE